MKPYKCMPTMLLLSFLMALASGCGLVGSSENSAYEHIFLEEEAHLTPDASSPFCDFSIDYTYLNEEDDSIAALINRSVQREFLGKEFATLVPEVAVDSFKNVYLRDYRREVGEVYEADRAQAASEEEIPAWYNQTYSMVTFIEEGHGGILNVSANVFVDTGGAHPHQWSQWLNYDFETGKRLTAGEVFLPSARKDIEQLLLAKLIGQQAALNPEEKVETVEDLNRLGFLQLTSMYIPENFLLSQKGLLFLFNRYDIAPYAAGEIVIEVPYEEIGHCMTLFND
jgi:hypothetical protein